MAKLADEPAETRERLLTQSLAHFRNPIGRDLLARAEPFRGFVEGRARYGLWPYGRALEQATGPRTTISDATGVTRVGINFASQDYLGLSQHSAVREAGIDAMRTFGPHSAGSAILLGNTRLSLDLERHVAELVQMEHVALYPTGWAAGYGAIAAFVRPRDHVLLDYLSHACLQQGAAAATQNVGFFAHNDVEELRAKLKAIRADDRRNGILVVTEGVFSMDSDTPDIRALLSICREYEATLLVDVAHDLGAMGPGGGGVLAEQGMLGKVDLVMGSFSKTFASNGGFLASHSAAAKQFAKYFGNPHMFSNALSPVQAAVVSAAIRIVRSGEGDQMRASLMRAVTALRDGFAERQVACYGTPSAIVPVPFKNDVLARLASRRIVERGVFVNLVEYPAVPLGEARLRMQVMATHQPEGAAAAVKEIMAAIEEARRDLEELQS